jgi:hypothetical protein
MSDVSSAIKRPRRRANLRYTVSGTITSRVRASIGTLSVQLIDKNIGGDDVLADTTSGADGTYVFKDLDLTAALKKRCKTSPDFQVQ